MLNRIQTITLSLFAVTLLSLGSSFAADYGYGYGSGTPKSKPIKTPEPAETAAPVAIKISGDILADKNGMTLYTFDKDVAGSGKSACDGGCAAKWHALFAANAAKDMGEFSIVVRNDGRKQWAYKGRPLYLWTGDSKAGDATGDGVGGVWHKATR